MATLVQFRSVVSTDMTWTDAVSKKFSSKALIWVRTASRPPRPMGLRMSSREGSLQEQYLEEMTEVSPCSESNGLQRGKFLERKEESSTSERREFLVSSLLLSMISGLAWTSTAAIAAGAPAAQDTTTEVSLEVYSNSKDGFTLMRPTPWNKVDKPGASIFFEDPESKSNNIGVTVAPVRIASLDGFGTVDDIVKKLVKAERDKPSTKDIQVVGVLEKKLRDNSPLYALEYTLDTTRGSKRVLTSVTVAGYKLYILNIIFADDPVAPASQGLNDALHQVLNSFELLA